MSDRLTLSTMHRTVQRLANDTRISAAEKREITALLDARGDDVNAVQAAILALNRTIEEKRQQQPNYDPALDRRTDAEVAHIMRCHENGLNPLLTPYTAAV